MLTGYSQRSLFSMALLLVAVCASAAFAVEMPQSTVIEQDLQAVRYEFAAAVTAGDYLIAAGATGDNTDEFGNAESSKKSPFKAFLLSAAVPGLGQYYYGSKVKPLIFLGAELAAWGMHIKWHGDGDDATQVYHDYNHDHWSEERYSGYLQMVYGETDDEDVSAQEVSHHLPDTKVQQYYEMTGKYDQFSWGWDDATLDGRAYDSYSAGDHMPAITSKALTPESPNRMYYEGLRDDANKKYDKANKMIIASIANHLLSAFEAYFVTKHRYEKGSGRDSAFTRVKVRTSLKSYYEQLDTPFVNLSYKF